MSAASALSNGLDDTKYKTYYDLFSSFLYVKDIDGVGSIMFHMKLLSSRSCKYRSS